MKRTITILLVCLFGISAFAAKAAKRDKNDICQILDVPFEPVVQLSGGFVQSSPVEDYGDISLVEIDAHWAFAHLWDILFGDIDMALRLNSTFFSDSTDIDLPSQLSRIALGAGWTGRFGDGISLQARIFPGIYSDFREFGQEALYMPVSVAVIKAFDSKLSGIVGAEVRPGFEQQIMPLIGVAWMINERTRLDARLPESRFVYYLGRGWSTHAGFKWSNMSYGIHENNLGADQVTMEDFRLFWGTTFRLSDNIQFSGEIGRAFERDIEYDNTDTGAESKFDVDAATFVRFTLGGPF
ncbi:MAG: DUF6268 family outer membrane beta-barrel protein [Kiritimatiellae bacterium]|nr:DUF6268 family outer membrane beta-barrel protein [Kiritimatiellia bacterium]